MVLRVRGRLPTNWWPNKREGGRERRLRTLANWRGTMRRRSGGEGLRQPSRLPDQPRPGLVQDYAIKWRKPTPPMRIGLPLAHPLPMPAHAVGGDPKTHRAQRAHRPFQQRRSSPPPPSPPADPHTPDGSTASDKPIDMQRASRLQCITNVSHRRMGLRRRRGTPLLDGD